MIWRLIHLVIDEACHHDRKVCQLGVGLRPWEFEMKFSACFQYFAGL
jgi:hypothetical protein